MYLEGREEKFMLSNLQTRRTWKKAPVKKPHSLIKENKFQKIEKIIYEGKSALSITYKSNISLKNLSYVKTATNFLSNEQLPFSKLLCIHHNKNGYEGIWSFCEGKVKQNWTTVEYKALGTFLGKLHTSGKNYKNTYVYKAPIIISLKEEYLALKQYLPSSFDHISVLLETIEEKWPLFLPIGLVHTDLFANNILFQHGNVSGVLQNHNLQNDILLYDLTSVIKSLYFTNFENIKEKEDTFFNSYAKETPLCAEEIKSIPILTAAKFLFSSLMHIKNHLNDEIYNNTHLNSAAISLIHAEKALHLYE